MQYSPTIPHSVGFVWRLRYCALCQKKTQQAQRQFKSPPHYWRARIPLFTSPFLLQLLSQHPSLPCNESAHAMGRLINPWIGSSHPSLPAPAAWRRHRSAIMEPAGCRRAGSCSSSSLSPRRNGAQPGGAGGQQRSWGASRSHRHWCVAIYWKNIKSQRDGK